MTSECRPQFDDRVTLVKGHLRMVVKYGKVMNTQISSKRGLFAHALLTLFAIMASFSALAQNNDMACGSLKTGYGPFDYRTDRDKLEIVEQYHFTPQVEALIRGSSSMHIGADLAYTLNAFPNHHRALMSVMRYGEKLKTPQPEDMQYSVECYFRRALRFRPDDAVARMIYATFLTTKGRPSDALRELGQVEKTAGDNAFTYYNLGLIYVDMKEYEKALTQAHKAMALGFNRTGLRDKLMQAGKWREPEDAPTPAVGSAGGVPATAK